MKLAAWLLSIIFGFVVTSDKYESCGISVELQCGGCGKHCETCGILLKSILVAVVSSDKLLACLLIRILVTVVVTSGILCDRLVYLLSSNVAAEVT